MESFLKVFQVAHLVFLMEDSFAIEISISHALNRFFQVEERIFKQALVKDANLPWYLLYLSLEYLEGRIVNYVKGFCLL